MASDSPTTRSGHGRIFPLPALAALLFCCALWFACCPGARPASGSEYEVKAAFLYNFLKFVDWPAEGGSGTVTIGILGRDPFDDALDGIKGKLAKGRRVAVQHFRSVDEVKGCDVLFIASSEKGRRGQVLRMLRNRAILTVADQEGFCEAGGMINLVFVKNRVGFEINLAAANRARLKISSQILKLARVVLE